MKTYLTTAAAILLFATTTAQADIWASNKPPQLPSAVEYSRATHDAVAGYIAAQGWCARKTPAPKSGQIVVYYTRDKSGRCVTAFKQGR